VESDCYANVLSFLLAHVMLDFVDFLFVKSQ